jgi:hypothetical protein
MKKENFAPIEYEAEHIKDEQFYITLLRYSLVLCLIVAAIVCGYETFVTIESHEKSLLQEQFKAVADPCGQWVTESISKARRSLVSIAEVMPMQCPTDDLYPNCTYPFAPFVKLVSPLVTNGDMRAMGFAPFVRADQVSSFESYAYSIYETQGFPAIGIHKFGKGIMAVDGRSGVEHHDTTGSVLGKRSMLVPVLEAAPIKSNNRSFMYNLYSEASRIAAIDRMLDCFEANIDGDGAACTSVTGVVQLVQDSDEVLRPAVLMFRPVVVPLESGNHSVAGLVYAAYNWDNLLQSSVPVSAPAVDIVLLASGQEFTYR